MHWCPFTSMLFKKGLISLASASYRLKPKKSTLTHLFWDKK